MKEKFKVKLTEYMIRRIMLELSLCPDGIIRHVLGIYCCRHTYVSQLQALGVSMETIQSMVGHADIDMTRHYLHVQEPKRQGAIALFDEALNKND